MTPQSPLAAGHAHAGRCRHDLCGCGRVKRSDAATCAACRGRKATGTFPAQPFSERLWTNVDRTAGPGACWVWLGTIRQGGLGQIWDGQRRVAAHRATWAALIGPIPAGYVLLQGCARRSCVNPAHWALVTHSEISTRFNGRRRPTCARGHAMVADNLLGGRRRKCKTCHRARMARWREQHLTVARARGAARTANRRADDIGAHGRISQDDVLELWRCQPQCVGCGEGFGLDHRVPFARGGTNTTGNLQNLCTPCNQRKGSRLPEELAA